TSKKHANVNFVCTQDAHRRWTKKRTNLAQAL
ncbi:hypothetical protein L914_19972, partial [Phytophthora nicotianae]